MQNARYMSALQILRQRKRFVYRDTAFSALSAPRALSPARPRAARRRKKFYLLKGVKKDIIKKISFLKAGIWLRR